MKYKQDDKTYSVKGKPINLIKGIIVFLISCFLLYILGFYCVKFINTFKPLFKIGLNDELKNKDYDKPTVLILDKGFYFAYQEFDESIFILLEVSEDNDLGLEEMKFGCSLVDENIYSINLKTKDNEIIQHHQEIAVEDIKNTYLSIDFFNNNDLSVDKVRWSNVPNPFTRNEDFHCDVYLKSNKDKIGINLNFMNDKIDFGLKEMKTSINYKESSFGEASISWELTNPKAKKDIWGGFILKEISKE